MKSHKGPLTTPVGGGIRSLNVALRQMDGSALLKCSEFAQTIVDNMKVADPIIHGGRRPDANALFLISRNGGLFVGPEVGDERIGGSVMLKHVVGLQFR